MNETRRELQHKQLEESIRDFAHSLQVRFPSLCSLCYQRIEGAECMNGFSLEEHSCEYCKRKTSVAIVKLPL